jgi:hypothetical protein
MAFCEFMKKNVLVVLILAVGASRAADVQPLNVKPGLWETTMTTEMGGIAAVSIPPEKLAQLPPEQRARIEAQLKGIGAPTTSTTQSCHLPGDLDKPFASHNDRNKSCKTTGLVSTGSKQEMAVECEKATGTVKIEATDSNHVNGNILMHVTTNGRAMDMKITIASKWLSSSCGDVKPVSKQD